MKNTRKLRRVRPTPSIVKNALFNILGDIKDLVFLDLFAGTGQIGLEAEKRGAQVIFIEKSKSLTDKIKHKTSGKVIRADVLKALEKLSVKPHIIFADPPYSFENYDLLIEKALKVLIEGGVFILEHDKRKRFSPDEERIYGDTVLSLWRK